MGLFKIQPIDPKVTAGAKTGIFENIGAGYREARPMVGAGRALEDEMVAPARDLLRQVMPADLIPGGKGSGTGLLSLELARRVHAEGNDRLSPATLQSVLDELDAQGFEYPDAVKPINMQASREAKLAQVAKDRATEREIMDRGGISGTIGGFIGGIGAEFTDPVNLATLPFGAPAKSGLALTMAVEAAINAIIEGGQTPAANKLLKEMGEPEQSMGLNMLVGGVFGASLPVAFKGAGKVGGAAIQGGAKAVEAAVRGSRFLRSSAARIASQSASPATREAAQVITRDVEDEAAAIVPETPEARQEFTERAQEAAIAASEGRLPNIPDRPLAAAPSRADDGSELVDPRTLLVQPDVFQFKSEIVAPGGVTPKLAKVKTWIPHRAGVAIVYEYADGSRAIADGHQRTALARRIMEQDPSQNIQMRAEVFREADGFSIDDVRVLAAMKNISEAADGMTARMAGDAAKILRISPEAIADLPSGPGIARAQSLSKLSDDAFDLYINRVIDERFAEQIGRLVKDPSMHLPIARLIERVQPETTEQAANIITQALEAPTSRETTADLFGESEVIESLFLEQAKVLERSMKIMRDDRAVFKTLTDQAARIEGAGSNKLDKATNAEARQVVENALAVIKAMAHRAGPISEALRNGAKDYKANGRLKDAAEAVANAVRGEIERNGIAGLGAGGSGRAAQPSTKGELAPDANAEFADPVGKAAQDQVNNTRLVANEKPAEGFSQDKGGLEDLKALVDAGADRAVIDNHPVVIKAIEDMSARPETRLAEGYNTEAWHTAREYNFKGETVVGTKAALARWLDGAERLASVEKKVPFEGVKRDRELTIILGPPAAGKSTIANDLALSRGAAILDSDEIKGTIPEYDKGIGAAAVHEESGDLASILENVLMEDGTNIVLPKVGGSSKSIRKTIDRYKAAGYTVRLANMAVTKDNAYRRMIARFVKTGRLIPPSYVDEVGDKPSGVFRELKAEGRADGYAEIDNNGGMNDAKEVREVAGENPFAGTIYDLEVSGRTGQDAQPGGLEALGRLSEGTAAGEQLLIDGIAAITEMDRMAAAQAKPMRGGSLSDDSQIGGLFDPGDAARGADLFDQVPVGKGFDADGNEVSITKSRAELAAELDADDEFVSALEVCLK